MQNLSPIGWALRPLKNYAKFSGRAPRAEFWWFFLFMFVVWMAVYFLMIGTMFGAANGQNPPSAGVMGAFGGLGIILLLFWLAMLLPTLAVQTRRLHDTDRSGWWLGGFYLVYAAYFAMLFGSMGSMLMGGAQPNPSQVSGGMFGATMILGLVMFVYAIVLLVFYCLPGTKGPNRFGEDPYGANVEEVFA
jgi:uncharacterized membrane protein YhaH (DUF805 family)